MGEDARRSVTDLRQLLGAPNLPFAATGINPDDFLPGLDGQPAEPNIIAIPENLSQSRVDTWLSASHTFGHQDNHWGRGGHAEIGRLTALGFLTARRNLPVRFVRSSLTAIPMGEANTLPHPTHLEVAPNAVAYLARSDPHANHTIITRLGHHAPSDTDTLRPRPLLLDPQWWIIPQTVVSITAMRQGLWATDGHRLFGHILNANFFDYDKPNMPWTNVVASSTNNLFDTQGRLEGFSGIVNLTSLHSICALDATRCRAIRLRQLPRGGVGQLEITRLQEFPWPAACIGDIHDDSLAALSQRGDCLHIYRQHHTEKEVTTAFRDIHLDPP